jgi:hypothetical protein
MMREKELFEKTSAMCMKMVVIAEALDAKDLLMEAVSLKLEYDRRMRSMTQEEVAWK